MAQDQRCLLAKYWFLYQRGGKGVLLASGARTNGVRGYSRGGRRVKQPTKVDIWAPLALKTRTNQLRGNSEGAAFAGIEVGAISTNIGNDEVCKNCALRPVRSVLLLDLLSACVLGYTVQVKM